MPPFKNKSAIGLCAAMAWHDWQGRAILSVWRDNMREVAVTEGDKVAAQIQFGYSVNGYGIGDLVKCVSAVTDREVDRLTKEYDATYKVAPALKTGGAKAASVREAARIEASGFGHF